MKAVLKLLTIAVLAVLIAGALLVFTPLGDEPLAGLFPVGETEPVDFATLQLADSPNQYLLCPPGLCSARADAESAVYDQPVDALHARWDDVIAAQPRVEVLERDRTNQQIDYVQRSARFRFPDIITVRFIPLPENRSTIAIYSRSVFGQSDFGVNRERIEEWVAALEDGS